jgi:hypothetical protein
MPLYRRASVQEMKLCVMITDIYLELARVPLAVVVEAPRFHALVDERNAVWCRE